MAVRKRLIPFALLPAAWGLSGKTREKAKAEYTLDGYELDSALAEIELKDMRPDDYALAKAKIDHRYNKISDYDFDMAMAILENTDPVQQEVAKTEVDFKHKKINENEYNKRIANAKKEPWVGIVNFKVNPQNPSQAGEIELDWNDYFIDELKQNGYAGSSDFTIIHKWFDTLCSAVANDSGLVNLAGDTDVPPAPGKREYR